MKNISLEELTKLLEGGFNGQVLFNGGVEVNHYKGDGLHSLIYRASGAFRLTGRAIDCVRKDENNFQLGLSESNSEFHFRKSKGRVSVTRLENGRTYIRVPITLQEGALLEIADPTDILY